MTNAKNEAIPEGAVGAAYRALPYTVFPHLTEEDMRAALEAAAPLMLSHEREQTRLAHLDAMVNRETKREELAQAWDEGHESGYAEGADNELMIQAAINPYRNRHEGEK